MAPSPSSNIPPPPLGHHYAYLSPHPRLASPPGHRITTTTTTTTDRPHHFCNVFSFAMSLFTPFLFLSFLLVTTTVTSTAGSFEEFLIDQDVVKNMVRTFGRELSSAGTEQTCLGRIEENFQAYSSEVSWFDGNKMMDDMRMDVMNMLNWKRHAVERIANESERLASNHTYDKNIEVHYQNVKEFEKGPEELSTSKKYQQDSNFDNSEVDLEHSAIHVPVNVYEKSPDIINDIKWSEALTPFFKNNLAFDPSLSWQFFGSSKGFLRLYPSTPWKEPPNFTPDKPPPDFYDCRMRPWYIQGAASPKDIVILLDTSGSMTGVRKKIGISVVANILKTLTDDDYVAALQFAKDVKPINTCFDSLVQANKKNIMAITETLTTVKTMDLVNFTAALMEAFNMLQNFNRSGNGSQCNQAIMIVTDGAPNTYENIFKQYNWPNIPVRVFTYLIGHDSTSHNEVYWMACHNRGYYTHVSNLAEVHEQVQKYIPVMSRPIVLSGERVFSWTPVYAPTSELELNNWNWGTKQNLEIVSRLRQAAGAQGQVQDEQAEVESKSEDSDQEELRDRRQTNWASLPKEEQPQQTDGVQSSPQMSPEPAYLQAREATSKKDTTVPLYTTLSTPVFDTRNHTNITKRILIKNVYQDSEPETIRIANLLGVAGIDVPIKEIIKLTPAFKLGVNAYVFIISNNGYILYHPDLRPFYQEFLKPFYNSVDMSEVELAHNNHGPREWDPEIESIRNNMINRTHGWKKVTVKIHIDEMKRVVTRTNHYTHGMITNTPFSLAIALPEPYGSYRLISQVDLRMKHRVENFTSYFRGSQWRVHPEWAYCSSPHRTSQAGANVANLSPEEAIVQFLSNDLEKQNFRWRTSSIRPQVYETISCDKDLIQSLVLDAKLTDIPRDKCNTSPNFRDEQRIKTFGIVTTFLATRSGLTRYQDYRTEDEIKSPFYEEHTRAIEETYYQRAVDFYIVNKDAFVYSVDFNAGAQHEGRSPSSANFLVTATHALFIGNGKQSTPVAVVGIQFRYNILHEFFLNTTGKFNVPCTHMDVDCYLVDNNGFVVLANHRVADVGRFFGAIDGDIFREMVNLGVYRQIKMFDYQAICIDIESEASGPSASLFGFSILHQALRAVSHIISLLAALYVNTLYGNWDVYGAFGQETSEPSMGASRQDWGEPSAAAVMPSVIGYEPYFHTNRTTAQPCDKEFELFEMMDFSNLTRTQEIACGPNAACTRKYVAQYVPHTNLIMVLIVNNPSCTCQKSSVSIDPKVVNYSDKRKCELMRTEKNRKRPTTCHNYHPQEKDIRQCGGAVSLVRSSLLLVVSVALSTLLYRFHNSG